MKTRVPPTEERVEMQTNEEINSQIRRQIEANILYYSEKLDQIEQRLEHLDQEWDVERTLEANASVLAFIGAALGLVNRKFLLLPLVVGGFLFQHALQGWCPPVPIFRRLGFRTSREIHQERYALKALRGDFQQDEAQRSDLRARAMKAIEAAA
ncbi:MAG: DUF2892 domain-containing protein [Planctomycetes bacterium]|jgi:hypothetical protein|nr:DUF2892 domain-containing protein [Planctomycetota bacterium]